ncbi:hypothetical protein [Marinoscillum sp.]|uniref:hypothetical protein n=1 Tax=Marinoscillum sp. TaxID=2024838 RepID=UPI003BA89706
MNFKAVRLFSICFVVFYTVGFAQTNLNRIKIGKEISMEIPEAFHEATPAEIIQKNVSARTPLAMYTDYNSKVDIVVNETTNTWQGGDLEVIMSLYKASVVNLFDEIEFIQEGIQEVAGRQYIVFEFTSVVSDQNDTFGTGVSIAKYTYIQYTLHKNKILLFNFTCPRRVQNQWQNTAREIMQSVRIK